MLTLPTTAFLVALHVAAGSFLLMPIVPIRDFGLGFFRTVATVATVVMGVAVYLVPTGIDPSLPTEFGRFDTQALAVSYGPGAVSLFYLLFGLMLAYTLCIWAGRVGAAAGLLVGTLLLSLVAIGASAAPFVAAAAHVAVLTPAVFYVSAVFQASGLVAMLLGHQYLMPVQLPFRPLEIFAWIFLAAGAVQTALVGLCLVLALGGAQGTLLGSMLALEHPLGLFLWIRLGVGLVLVEIVAVMTLHCVRLRANMAATGLLYIGMSMAIGGEMFARLLTLTTSILL
jgi:hypothetical protein